VVGTLVVGLSAGGVKRLVKTTDLLELHHNSTTSTFLPLISGIALVISWHLI
jgi:hypothetical protein